MARVSSHRSLSCAVWTNLITPFILLSLLLFPSLSLSQAPTPTPAASPPSSLPPGPTQSPAKPTTLSTTRIPGSTTRAASDIASSILTSTSSSSTPSSTKDTPTTGTEKASAGEGDENGGKDHSSSALQYYFAFLALFVICLFIFIYIVHRRTKAKKARCRNSVQNALARDVDGWTGTRRWIGGSWRGEGISGDEGLNELGEAPPPYKSKHLSNEGHGRIRYSQHRDSGFSIPLRPLASGATTDGMKPPMYRQSDVPLPLGSLPALSRQHPEWPSAKAPPSPLSPVYQVGRITGRRSSA